MRILEIKSRPVTPEDNHLPWVDYSILSAIETCPTRGIVQYVAKKWPEGGRSMSLEAGNAFHVGTAAWNIYSSKLPTDLFGSTNDYPLAQMLEDAHDAKYNGGDAARAFAISALHNASGFIDSPDDKKRRMSVIEDSLNYWIDHQRGPDFFPAIAVEIPFEIVLEITFRHDFGAEETFTIRYVGRIDKVHLGHTGLVPVDYKTTTLGLDQSYEAQYYLSPQHVGYNLALPHLIQAEKYSEYAVYECIKFPVSKTPGVRSYMRRPYLATNYVHFAEFVIRNYLWIELYKQEGLAAIEQRSKSCNNYFSICPLLHGLCMQEPDARDDIAAGLEDYDWDPRNVR